MAAISRVWLAVAVVAGHVAAPAGAHAAEVPIAPAPTQFVTDGAGFLSPAAHAEMEQRLQSYESTSGHQVLLWVGRSTGDTPIEDWAVRAFAAWRVGRKGMDDGVVLFIMADDRKLRIEVGYGLEDRLPDARAGAIIRDAIVPRLRAGDRDGAARAGIDGILNAVGGATAGAPPAAVEAQRPRLGWLQLIALVVVGLVVVGFLITHPTLAVLLLTQMASAGRRRDGFGGGGWGGGGWGGGGSSGGGGFSGGGGRSGGGGATGSW